MKRLPRKKWRQLVRQYRKGRSAQYQMDVILQKHCTDEAYALFLNFNDLDDYDLDVETMIQKLELDAEMENQHALA